MILRILEKYIKIFRHEISSLDAPRGYLGASFIYRRELRAPSSYISFGRKKRLDIQSYICLAFGY